MPATHKLAQALPTHLSQPSPDIEALSMCMGLSTSDQVVFVSLVFHIKDKGKSLAVLTIDMWDVGEGHTRETAPGLSLTCACPSI